MDEFFLRFQHIPERFFEELDFESLANARLVARSWKQFIDAREHRLYPFKDEIADLKKKCRSDETPFHLASYNGQAGIAEIIMKNSAKFKIDLNAKANYGNTAFHLACLNGRTSIVDMLINNSEALKLDLTARDKRGKTGFQWAQFFGKTDVVNLIRTKLPEIAF